MELKQAKCGEQFQKEAKNYVINMVSNARTLHKKNCCYYSEFLQKYYDFDTMEEVERSGLNFVKCEKCFENKGDRL